MEFAGSVGVFNLSGDNARMEGGIGEDKMACHGAWGNIVRGTWEPVRILFYLFIYLFCLHAGDMCV